MSPKKIVGSLLRATGRLPGIKGLLYLPVVRRSVQHWPGFKAFYGGEWCLLHPFDALHHTDTSGFVRSEDLPGTPHDSTRKHVYAGSQPSIIRSALEALPSLECFTFVDLGCGKGRPLLVASEFPFRDVVGVELSPSLAADARANAVILKRKWPARVPIRVEVGDAGTFPLPAGNLTLYLYNPFGEEIILKVLARIEAALAAENRSLYVIYYNPVYGARFDASPALTRYYAATLPYSSEELGYGPDTEDTIVIWQGGRISPPCPGADTPIEIIIPGARAGLAR